MFTKKNSDGQVLIDRTVCEVAGDFLVPARASRVGSTHQNLRFVLVVLDDGGRHVFA